MLASERLLQIQAAFGAQVERIVVLELDEETLRLVLHLKDGTNLRVAEQWAGDTLKRYAYYWLTADNELKIGWDNAAHHTRLDNFPHHKHIGQKGNLMPSFETSLEQVMAVIRQSNE